MFIYLDGISEKRQMSILNGIELAARMLPGVTDLVSSVSLGVTTVNGSHVAPNGNPYYGVARLHLRPRSHCDIVLDKETLQQEVLQENDFWDEVQIRRWVVHEFCHVAELLAFYSQRPILSKIIISLKIKKLLIFKSAEISQVYYRDNLTKDERNLLKDVFDPEKECIQEFFPAVFDKYVFLRCGLPLKKEIMPLVCLVDRIVEDYQQMIVLARHRGLWPDIGFHNNAPHSPFLS